MRSIAKFKGKAYPRACQSAFAAKRISITCCTISLGASAPCQTIGWSKEDSYDGKSEERRASLEEAAHSEPILRHAPEGNRTSFHRRVRGHENAGNVQVRLLRPTAVPLRDEIPLRLRLAQFLRSCKWGSRCRGIRPQPWNAPRRSEMQPL